MATSLQSQRQLPEHRDTDVVSAVLSEEHHLYKVVKQKETFFKHGAAGNARVLLAEELEARRKAGAALDKFAGSGESADFYRYFGTLTNSRPKTIAAVYNIDKQEILDAREKLNVLNTSYFTFNDSLNPTAGVTVRLMPLDDIELILKKGHELSAAIVREIKENNRKACESIEQELAGLPKLRS